MLTITPIPALSDNYIWIIKNNHQAIIIDPSVCDKVLDYLNTHKLMPIAIWLTHEHHDHIGGVADILVHYPDLPIYCHTTHYQHQNVKAIDAGDKIDLFDKIQAVNIFKTAGHTSHHLSFVWTDDENAHIFCGDTLFKAGCGRVFTGTIDDLYQSFVFFNKLDDDFKKKDDNIYFYPAHEYTLSNLTFAQFLEPNNTDIATSIEKDMKLRENHLPTLPTTLQTERKINPFLRALKPTDALLNNARKMALIIIILTHLPYFPF